MIVADPSPEDWNGVWLHASWMRKVYLDEWFILEEGTLSKLHLHSPAGSWFPALQKLDWMVAESNLPFADLFFSPHLRGVSIYMGLKPGAPRDTPPTIISAISTLPTSTLRSLHMAVGYDVPSTHFTDSFSSLVLRCGPSLTKFACRAPLSDAAVNHLIHLPHLRSWWTNYPPPNSITSAPPYPSLFHLSRGLHWEEVLHVAGFPCSDA